MTRTVAVLRPEPGNAATVERLHAAGRTAIALPLFAVRALDWRLPDLGDHDALLLTSANAVRHGGEALDAVRRLPVIAVGAATADAARGAGFTVIATGAGNASDALAMARDRGFARLLHLGGRDRAAQAAAPVTRTIAVYASEPCAVPPAALDGLTGCTALLHSPRAAARLAQLMEPPRRPGIALAALSGAVATAAGPGWAQVAVAAAPTDAALIALLPSLD